MARCQLVTCSRYGKARSVLCACIYIDLRPTGPLCACTANHEIDPGCIPTPKCIVNHHQHYGGDTQYEAIKVIEAWKLGFCLGNTIKYISRAGKKDPAKEIEDLEKAAWYLKRYIDNLKKHYK